MAAALERLMPPGVALREREIVIDRTCARCGAEYEWGVHVAFFGERVGLTREEIAGICAIDVAASGFTGRELEPYGARFPGR